MNKVYLVTKSELFSNEQYPDVFSSKKLAEKYLKNLFPYMSVIDDAREGITCFASDAKHKPNGMAAPSWLLFIHEKTPVDKL